MESTERTSVAITMCTEWTMTH